MPRHSRISKMRFPLDGNISGLLTRIPGMSAKLNEKAPLKTAPAQKCVESSGTFDESHEGRRAEGQNNKRPLRALRCEIAAFQ